MKDVKVEVLSENKKPFWDRFVDNSSNGTIFHKQSFLDYHREKYKDNERHLMFYDGGKLIAVLPMAVFEHKGKRIAKSPYGGSFGGFVYKRATYSKINNIITAFKKYAIENCFDQVKIVPPPSIYLEEPETYQDYCLQKEQFQLVQRDLSSIVTLFNKSEEKIIDTYKYSCRRKLKKAYCLGLVTRKVTDLSEFFRILIENHEKFEKEPTHTLDELERLISAFPECINIFGAYSGNELAAGVLCISVNKRAALSFYICHSLKYKEYEATALAIHSTISWALNQKFDYLDMGTSSVGVTPGEGLIQFKEGFGGTAIFRDIYSIKL